MASEIIVQTLKGPTSGANANKVIIPSGQTLDINTWSPPAGTVLQVVSVSKTDEVSHNTTSYASFGLDGNITPSSTSSKILVIVSVNCISCSNGSGVLIRTRRGSTDLIVNTTSGATNSNTGWFTGGGQIYTGQNRQRDSATITVLDSPSTTDQITYACQFKVVDSGATAYINRMALAADTGSVSTMTLMEIAG